MISFLYVYVIFILIFDIFDIFLYLRYICVNFDFIKIDIKINYINVLNKTIR